MDRRDFLRRGSLVAGMALAVPLIGQPKLAEDSSLLLPGPPRLSFHAGANRVVTVDGFALRYDGRWDCRDFGGVHLLARDSLDVTWHWNVEGAAAAQR